VMKNFKHLLKVLFFILIALPISAQEYQLQNAGFESWDSDKTDSEPVKWNSFSSAQCDMSFGCDIAKKPHHFRIQGGRPGTQGQYYLTIYSTSIMGIVANGNMTSGQIRIGSMSAASTENYNFTNRENSEHSQTFTKTPDSLYLWVKYYAADEESQARVATYIHGNTDFKDPNDVDNINNYKGKAVLMFKSTGSSAQNALWVQKKIPFVYDGKSTSNYIILTLTNNATPGGGSAGDSLSIDDIELVYSAWANKIKINDKTLAGFQKTTFTYDRFYQQGTDPSVFPEITVIPEANDASIDIDTLLGPNNNLDSAKTIITITAEDNITQKVYTINHYIAKTVLNNNPKLAAIYIDGIALTNFHPDTLSYQYELSQNYPGIPAISVDLQDNNASYDITPVSILPAQAHIDVLAQDGETSLTYIIDFSVKVNVAESHPCDGISLFPNPTRDVIRFTCNNQKLPVDKIQIVDLYGKQILTHAIKDCSFEINIGSFAEGMYFFKLMKENKTLKTFKVIKY
jgi:hypothetical protein